MSKATLSRILPLLIISFIGLMFSLGSATLVWWLIRNQELNHFTSTTLAIQNNIQSRFERYENALLHTRALFSSSSEVTRTEFHRYIKDTDLLKKYPGIQGIGYVPRLSPDEVFPHQARIKKEGIRNYQVWPKFPRKDYFPILYLEPMDWRNRRAIGYDMSTEANRREAMNSARDQGTLQASRLVTLVQETNREPQKGFLVYAPLYKDGDTPETLQKKRKLLRGFVYAPFRVEDFFQNTLAEKTESTRLVELKVFDGAQPRQENLIFDTLPAGTLRAAQKPGKYSQQKQMSIAGRTWTFFYSSVPHFSPLMNRLAPPITFFAGLLITGLTLLIMRAQIRQRVAEQRLLDQTRIDVENLRIEQDMREKFVAALSHDLRNPISAVHSSAQLIQRYPDRTELIQKSANAILRALARADTMLQDLLDVSKIRAGRTLPIELEHFDLQNLILTLTAELNEARNGRIVTDLKEQTFVYLNQKSIQRILDNLINNAFKYGSADTPVTVSLKKFNESVRLSVHNRGNPLSQEDQLTIFQPFRRSKTAEKSNKPGWGLGLTLVRGLAQAHGGHVWVESSEEKGTTFVVELPQDARGFVKEAA